MPMNRRTIERRFTDTEIDEILMHARGYINGTRKRQLTLGAAMGMALTATTLINIWIVTPIKENIETLRHEMVELEKNVASHHETQPSEYVLKKDFDRHDEKMSGEVAALRRIVERMVEVRLK